MRVRQGESRTKMTTSKKAASKYVLCTKTAHIKLRSGEITPPAATTRHEKVAKAFRVASEKTGTFSSRYAK